MNQFIIALLIFALFIYKEITNIDPCTVKIKRLIKLFVLTFCTYEELNVPCCPN